MAAAQMALAIEMDNRMKRKAAAMGFFLNVETQRKFLKVASNVELRTKVCNLWCWQQKALEDKRRHDTEIRNLQEQCEYYYAKAEQHQRAEIALFAELEQVKLELAAIQMRTTLPASPLGESPSFVD